MHQDTSLIEQATIGDIEGLQHLTPKILAVTEKSEGFEYQRGGDKFLLNVRYIASLEWLLFVEQNETVALREARMNFVRTVAIGMVTSVVVILIMLAAINRYQRLLEKLAVSDELTGCANRRKLEEEYGRFAYRNNRSGKPFSLILMDLDHFKEVNDTLGHLHGDDVLCTISREMATAIRPTDVLARWGGDEFALLTESSHEDASLVAERIRQVVAGISWPKKQGLPVDPDPRSAVTVSLGIAAFRADETFSELLQRADQALYRCKELGGNRVALFDQACSG